MAFLGILVSLSSALYAVESFIPFPLPFGRWGFSNSVVLYCATLSLKSAVTVAAAKSILGSIFTGRFFSPTFWMGFLGSIGAAVVERGMVKIGMGYIGASIAGSATNNFVQLAVGYLIIRSPYIFSILPIFLILGTISAIANAYLAKSYERVKEVKR